MILPKKNLRAVDIGCTIGEYVPGIINGVRCNTIATDAEALCTSDKINIWAKYKPVPNNFTQVRPEEWWRGTTRECGIKVEYQQIGNESLLQSIRQKIIDKYNFFKPIHPNGSQSEPFRLGDFAGYNPQATHNVVNISVPDSAGWNNGSGIDNAARVTMAVQWRHEEDMISLSDLRVNEGVFNLAEWYLGAILNIPADKESARIVTNDTPLADMENVDWIEFTVGGTGTITIYPVLCQQSNTTLTTYLGGYAIPLPNLGSYECKIVEAQRATLSFAEDECSIDNYTNEFRVNLTIHYDNVKTVPTDVPGRITVAAATEYSQPLGPFVKVPYSSETDIWSIPISSSRGDFTINSFTVNKDSIGVDKNDPNFKRLLCVFTPTNIVYGNTIYFGVPI